MAAWACDNNHMYVYVFQPQPLAFLEEDIREVLKQETGADIFNRADIQPDYRAWKHNVCVACTCFPSWNYTTFSLLFWRNKYFLLSSLIVWSQNCGAFAVIYILILWFQIDGPARKVRKSLVLDPWGKDCLNVQLFQEQLNNAQVSLDTGLR